MGYQGRHRIGYAKRKKSRKLLTFLFAFALILVLCYPFAEPYMLQVEKVSLTSADLPQQIRTLRIAYLSDIHQGSFYSVRRVNELVSKVNALNPDIILLGGDYATDSDSAIEFFRNAQAFHARYAVCAVLGDADRTLPESNLGLLKAAMFSAGITPLVNEVTEIRLGTGSSIWIAGADDPLNGKPNISLLASQVKQSDYVIFLAHSPDLISDALSASGSDGLKNWFDLGLFGHTHGGQISLLGRMLGIGSDVDSRYESGWIQQNRIDMLISRGVGTTKLPIRILCKPQIHLITIKSK